MNLKMVRRRPNHGEQLIIDRIVYNLKTVNMGRVAGFLENVADIWIVPDVNWKHGGLAVGDQTIYLRRDYANSEIHCGQLLVHEAAHHLAPWWQFNAWIQHCFYVPRLVRRYAKRMGQKVIEL